MDNMNNKELIVKIENLINENEKLKKDNIELTHLKDAHYKNLKIALNKIDKLQKQYNNATITTNENLQQLEGVQKELEKVKNFNITFIRNSISILLKAMKYSQNSGQGGV